MNQAELEAAISDLYEKVSEVPVSPASFPHRGLLPGAKKPTGYAMVLKELEEARSALTSQQPALAERKFYEARSHFHWCKENVDWINGWVGIRKWPKMLGQYPRWLLLSAYLVAWVAVIGALTQAYDWEFLGVPMRYIFWGTLGGATAGAFGIWSHRVRSDFNPEYTSWYYFKPAIGAVAGALVVLIGEILEDGFADALTGGDGENSGGMSNGTSDKEALLLASAFVLGFFESLFISVLEVIRDKISSIMDAAFGRTSQAESP